MKKVMNQSTMTKMLNIGSIVLTLIAMILFLFSAQKNSQIDKENDNRYDLMTNANLFMNASSKLTSEVRQFAATGNEIHYNAYMEEVNEIKDRDTGVSNMQAIGLTEEENAMIDKMSSLSNNLVPLEEESMKKRREGKTEEAMEAVFGTSYADTVAQIKECQTDFLTSLDERTTETVEDLKMQGDVLKTIAIVFMILMAVAQFISLVIIDRKLLKPLGIIKDEMEEISKGNLSNPLKMEPDTSEIGRLVYAMAQTKQQLNSYIGDISEKLGKMASGDMRVHVDLVYAGDFAPIKTAIETISSALKETLTQIQEAAEQVLTGANQVSAGAQSLAQGSTEQASTIEEVSSTFQEVTNQVQQNAGYTQDAEEMVEAAATAIAGSNERMHKLMQAMEEVNRHSSQISQIIKSIEDIAFQTNILALNAAVEAARAGAAGKGFAVVADEVRNLAGKSAVAAANTTQMIENTVQAVDNGMAITKEAVEDLQQIVVSAQKTTELVREVSEGSQRQAKAISDVEVGVEQITSVVQTNSATSEESAATAQELSSQANMMRELVGRFKV